VTTTPHHPSNEAGFTLIELLTVLAILGIVLAALTQLLVAGLNTQSDQTKRAQGQLEARLALDKLRREVHCGASLSANGGDLVTGTQSITIVLPSYCRTNASGAILWVTWCTSGSGPYTLIRYARSTDYSSTNYSTACPGAGGQIWARNIVNSSLVSSGRIFSGYTPPTPVAFGEPDLSYGTVAGSFAVGTYRYVVDPYVASNDLPGNEGIINVGITGKSVLVDWTQACSLNPASQFRIYRMDTGGVWKRVTTQPSTPSTPCSVTTWTDTDPTSGTAATPAGSTRAKLTVTLPVRGGATNGRLITVRDDVTLRNTPR
jgi:prepilin-type N-terminal cleavage/methylation domain-containing protein